MNRGRQATPYSLPRYSSARTYLSGFRSSILQKLNLQAHNLTQLIQLEHVP